MTLIIPMSVKRSISSRTKVSKRRDIYVAGPLVIHAAILFCVVFAGVGLFRFLPSLTPLFWRSVPCEVLEFEVHDDADAKLPFFAEARYRFDWNGKPQESGQVGIPGWKDARTPLGLVRKFPENPKTVCYLPGGSVENAVLLRPSPKWGSLFFIGFGASMGWILFQVHRTRNLPPQRVARLVLPAFALLFGLPGLLLTLNISLPVWIESIEVLGWNETPATVVWSELRRQRNSKSTNYHADICYEYQAAGRTWRNNRVRAGELSGPVYSAAVELDRSFPVGHRTYCYLHPTQPERAVLLKWPGWELLFTLFPLSVLGVGIWIWRRVRREKLPSAKA